MSRQTMKHTFGLIILASISVVIICNLLLSSLGLPTKNVIKDHDFGNLTFAQLHKRLVESAYDDIATNVSRKHIPSSLNTRQAISLNGFYEFCVDFDNVGLKQRWQTAHNLRGVCQQQASYLLPVPSAFNDLVPSDDVRNFVGWVWYERELGTSTLDMLDSYSCSSALDKRVYIKFDNANYLALVWLNGRYLGGHVGGHLPFSFDVSQFLCNIPATSLKLTVAVSNELSEETLPTGQVQDYSSLVGETNFRRLKTTFDFFYYAGIMGDVTLVKVSKLSIDRIYLTRSHITWLGKEHDQACRHPGPQETHKPFASSAELEFRVLLSDESHDICSAKSSSKNLDCKLEYKVSDVAKSEQVDQDVYRWQTIKHAFGQVYKYREKMLTLRIDKPKLWKPYAHSKQGSSQDSLRFNYRAPMYKLEVRLIADARTLDTFETLFGIREFNLYTTHIELNKQEIKLTGFGYHEEHFPSGRTMQASAYTQDFLLFKQLYVNTVRTSHYPYSERFLDMADENGIIVIAEAPAVQIQSFPGCSSEPDNYIDRLTRCNMVHVCNQSVQLKLHKLIMREMLERDSNHPSIFAWSLANEPYTQLPAAEKYFSLLTEDVRSMSASGRLIERPLTAAIAQSAHDDTVAHLLDLVMTNYYAGWYDHGGLLKAVPKLVERWIESWAMEHPNKLLLMSEFGAEALPGLSSNVEREFGEDYQRQLLDKTQQALNKYYLQGPLIGELVWNFADFETSQSLTRIFGNHKGVFTQRRRPKTAASLIEARYKSMPLLKTNCNVTIGVLSDTFPKHCDSK